RARDRGAAGRPPRRARSGRGKWLTGRGTGAVPTTIAPGFCGRRSRGCPPLRSMGDPLLRSKGRAGGSPPSRARTRWAPTPIQGHQSVQGGPPTPPSRGGRRIDEDGRPRAVSRVYGRVRSGRGGPVQPLSGGYGGGRGEGRRRPVGKIVIGVLAALVALLLVGGVGVVFWVNGRLITIDGVLDDYEGRPADTPGENWLLVGSDSRKGLSKAQRKKLATGRAAGQRTDTMMLLHIPE